MTELAALALRRQVLNKAISRRNPEDGMAGCDRADNQRSDPHV